MVDFLDLSLLCDHDDVDLPKKSQKKMLELRESEKQGIAGSPSWNEALATLLMGLEAALIRLGSYTLNS
jgi:hypothetical protein